MVGLRLSTRASIPTTSYPPKRKKSFPPPKKVKPPVENPLYEDGCDYEHWLVVFEEPEGEPTRDEIIDSYIKTLAQVVGSEKEARMKIYSVSTKHYFAFGVLLSEELSNKLKDMPGVIWVLPDSYSDGKSYGGEPFVDGQAVPYDPKYHEEWVRNRAAELKENMQNKETQPSMQNSGANMGGPPGPNMQHPGPMRVPPMQFNMGSPPNANRQNNVTNYAGPNAAHSNNVNMGNKMSNNGLPRDAGPTAGHTHNTNVGVMPNRYAGPSIRYPNIVPQYRDARNSGGNPHQSRDGPGPIQNRDYQNSYTPSRHGSGHMPNREYKNSYIPSSNMGVRPNTNLQHPGPNMGVPPMRGPPNANMQNSVPNYAGPNAAHYTNVNMGNRMPNYGPPRDAGPTANTYVGFMPNRDAGPSVGYPNSVPQYRDAQNNGGVPHHSRDGPGPMPTKSYENSYTPSSDMGNVPSNNANQVREIPGKGIPSKPNPKYH